MKQALRGWPSQADSARLHSLQVELADACLTSDACKLDTATQHTKVHLAIYILF